MAMQHQPHASVKLDPHAMGHDHAHHEAVEPIPWKTGKVGVVDAIDTTAQPVIPRLREAQPRNPPAPSGGSFAAPAITEKKKCAAQHDKKACGCSGEKREAAAVATPAAAAKPAAP